MYCNWFIDHTFGQASEGQAGWSGEGRGRMSLLPRETHGTAIGFARYPLLGARYQVTGIMDLVPGSWDEVLAPGTWYYGSGTKSQVPGTRFQV